MIREDAIVFGLTGAFGSGCTTLASALREHRAFSTVKLSDLILAEWRDRERARTGTEREPPRGALQDLGDARRSFHQSAAYWAQQAIADLEGAPSDLSRVALDGLRNPAEIEWLRTKFKNFFVVAVDAPWDERWERLKDEPTWRRLGREEFDRVSSRDRDSGLEWGQRVQTCVDEADYVITNDEHLSTPQAQALLLAETDRLIALVDNTSGDETITRPRDDEAFMHIADASSSRSACIKRQVGAVLVRPGNEPGVSGKVIAVGYNENPDHMQPCYVEFKECYRDKWRREEIVRMGLERCPVCGSRLAPGSYPPVCTNSTCAPRGNLLNVIFPERAMSHCTAIHAEVRAILGAGASDLAGTTLYSTTFPCFLCAQQIVNAGISRVVYIEAYPDQAAEQVLALAGTEVRRFNGVRSNAYDRLFRRWRERVDR